MHEKPFACPLCDKRFATSSLWLKHQSAHSGTLHDSDQTYTNSTSLKTQQRSQSKARTNLCPECGKVYTVTARNHECNVGTEGSKDEMLISHPPQLPQPSSSSSSSLSFLQQQFQQQLPCNQHRYKLPSSEQHQHQTQQQISDIRLAHVPVPEETQQQQLLRNHSFMAPPTVSAAMQAALSTPSQTFLPLPSSSSSISALSPSPSNSSTIKPTRVSSHMMLHLQSPPTAASALPSHHHQIVTHSPTLRSVLQTEQSPQRMPSQLLLAQASPSQRLQQYNMSREEGRPGQVQDSQSYTMTQSRAERGENAMTTSFVAGSETAGEIKPNYNYVIVYDNPTQQ
ncbi:zinc finger protein 768 [Elysia marginata]|uniref:Zinc finger protein 768 n=1 Tax=Elysia marginata TaxID=1093978 RepID=A0AAV4EL48_9GAST|nr:zinc finger protein 768 [Elysia marginata]